MKQTIVTFIHKIIPLLDQSTSRVQ